MRHRFRFWPVLALAAVAAVGSRPPPARADDAPSKSFPDKNFKWTLPPGWTLEDAEGEHKDVGYVCVARKELDTSKHAAAWVRVVEAGKASLDDLVTLAKKNKMEKLNDPDATPPGKVDWAGVADARYLQISGSEKGGAPVAYRLFSAIVEGKLHQMDIRTWNGAEADLMSDLDAVAAGYRVLKGGSTRPSGGDGAGPAPESGGGGDPLTARFDKLGLTWTLPAAKEGVRSFSFTSQGPADVVPKVGPGIGLAQARLQGEGPEVTIEASVQKAKSGITARALVNNDDNFDELLKDSFDGTPVPNLDEDMKLGNWRGARKDFTGKDKEKKVLFIRTIFSVLRDGLYVVRVVAHDKGEMAGHQAIVEALAGFKWDDASEGVRGPVATEFSSVTSPRPDAGEAKDTVIKEKGVTIKKPAAFASIRFVATDKGFDKWVTAMEARKTGAYMFIGVQKYAESWLKNSIPPQTSISLIDEYENKWMNAVGEAKTMTQKAGKANKTPDSFRGAKGFRYEFSGTFEENPFLERGWVVSVPPNVYWVKVQYGGKDAEAAFANESKLILGTMKVE